MNEKMNGLCSAVVGFSFGGVVKWVIFVVKQKVAMLLGCWET